MESILMIGIMFALMYFMLIRPENKRKKAAENMRNSLKKGDKITTIGGIVGTIVKVDNATIVIETSDDRVRMELTKWAVSTTGVQTTDQPNTKQGKDELPDAVPEEPAAPEEEASEEESQD